MKKILIAALLFLGIGSARADTPGTVVRSTWYVSSGSFTVLSQPGYLTGVIVSKVSTGGVLTLWDSTATTSAQLTTFIGSVTLTSLGNYNFYDQAVHGITIENQSNSSGFTILYRKR